MKKLRFTSSIVTMLAVIIGIISCNNQNKSETNTVQKAESFINETPTTVLPFMNERQKQLRDLYNKGQIRYVKYKEMLDADNSIYEDLLISTDLSRFEVYTDAYNTDGSTVLKELKDGLKRKEIRDIIQIAIREGRIKWLAAISGEKYGTYISIIPKSENGEIKGVNRGMTIFIAGLFEESVRNAFDCANTKKDSI